MFGKNGNELIVSEVSVKNGLVFVEVGIFFSLEFRNGLLVGKLGKLQGPVSAEPFARSLGSITRSSLPATSDQLKCVTVTGVGERNPVLEVGEVLDPRASSPVVSCELLGEAPDSERVNLSPP